MKFDRIITESAITALRNYPWIEKALQLGDIGTRDDREILSRLQNSDIGRINQVLSLVENHGPNLGEIGVNILQCNDHMSFPRYLSELYLFAHIVAAVGEDKVIASEANNTSHPDMEVALDDQKIRIEVYTPTDFYGYQVFTSSIIPIVINLDVRFGYSIRINIKSTEVAIAHNFPDFRSADIWIRDMAESIKQWLESAEIDQSVTIQGPKDDVQVEFHLQGKSENRDDRSISLGYSTISTDTRIYFERDWDGLDNSQWGVKILDKLEKQQAGLAEDNVTRLLAINFALADTYDLHFLMENRYHKNIKALVERLAQRVEPYPPYDSVIPCALGLTCGFASPIILAQEKAKLIAAGIAECKMNEPIQAFPVASEEESDRLIRGLLEA